MRIDVMKQALEALENAVLEWRSEMEFRSCIDVANTWAEAAEVLRAAIEQPEHEPVAWVYQEGLEALKSGRPWTAYGSNGEGRIPLYLNDAVAPKAEPRESGSGAGFESLPASPKWWDEPVAQMNYRKWQGLTDDEIKAPIQRAMQHFGFDPTQYSLGGAATIGFLGLAKEIEAKLREKNT